MKLCVVQLCCCVFAFLPTLAIAEEGIPTRAPEDDVLSKYVGEWDFSYTSDKPPLTNGTFTGRWILDGQFVEQVGELTAARVPNDIRLKILMRYDPNEKTYRKWTFISNGRVLTALGSWNEATRTMSWVTEYDEGPLGKATTYTTTETFTKAGEMRWTKKAVGPNDPLGNESRGTSIRRKP